MIFDDWQTAVRPKVQGSWNLHTLLPRNLDFFILLSSISDIFGAPSQTNYAAGNSFMDSLAHYRISQGEKAVSIDLGAILSEGILAENKSLGRRFMSSGFLRPISIPEFFALLDFHCDPSLEHLSSINAQPILGIEIPANIKARGLEEPYWLRRPTFRHLYQIHGTDTS